MLALASAIAFLSLATGTAVADQPPPSERETGEATEEQLRLNEEAVEALVAGNPGRAVALLTEAGRLGELNILTLNLGRAYHAAGRCDRAREVLESVPDKPIVERPPPHIVDERAAEYLAEVEESCREEEEQADLDPPPPEDQPPHEDSSSDDSSSDEPSEDEPSTDELSVEQPDGDEPSAEPITPTHLRWGLISGVAGVGLLGAGLSFHLAARQRRNRTYDAIHDEESFEDGVNTAITQAEVTANERTANTLDSIALGSAIVGATATALGVYLLFFHDGPEYVSDTVDAGFGFGPDYWTVYGTLRF